MSAPAVKLCSDCGNHWAEYATGRARPNHYRLTFCGLARDLRGPEARRACRGERWIPEHERQPSGRFQP